MWLVPGTDSEWRFASDPGRGDWCLAPIRSGDLLAIHCQASTVWRQVATAWQQVATVWEGRFASDYGSDLGPVPW